MVSIMYHDTHSQMARSESWRILLTLAVQKDWEVNSNLIIPHNLYLIPQSSTGRFRCLAVGIWGKEILEHSAFTGYPSNLDPLKKRELPRGVLKNQRGNLFVQTTESETYVMQYPIPLLITS